MGCVSSRSFIEREEEVLIKELIFNSKSPYEIL